MIDSGALKFGIATTRRLSTAQLALDIIPHHYAVTDHGTIIMIGSAPDYGWLETLRPYIGHIGNIRDPSTRDKRGVLWDYEAQIREQLNREGFAVFSDDRLGSFRVFPSPPASKADLERLLQIRRPDGIDAIIVRGFVDFFPSLAGKANGVKRVLSVEGVTDNTSVVYAGDDVSDVAALSQFHPVTTSEAEPSAREIALARGGYVAPFTKHEATRDIISYVAAKSRPDTRQ
ncbi:hypothetical protein HYV85_04415 [Candidatus Woesearchaeota archaeon]|nr:hypothetical protein [Candidatus Woesearchaeota archaeon]